MNARFALLSFPVGVVVVAALVLGSCTKTAEAPAAAAGDRGPADAPPAPVVTDTATNLLFSFIDAAGRVQAVPAVAAVPEAVRRRVLVVDLDKTPEQRQAHRFAYFADLTSRADDGSYPVVVVSRYDAATRSDGAPALPPPDGSVVVYSAEWCGYCKKAKAWLAQNDVPFVERDVEKTSGAQAELSAKLQAAGVQGAGIPVVDWGGEVVVGFDPGAFKRLLASAPPPKSSSSPAAAVP